MRQNLTAQEIVTHFTIEKTEYEISKSKTKENKLILLAFFKYYQLNGRFPANKYSLPKDAVKYLGEQLSLSSSFFYENNWAPRTVKRYRTLIREYLNFNRWKDEHKEQIKDYLLREVIPKTLKPADLKDIIYKYLQKEKIEPPLGKTVDQLITSSIYQWEYGQLKIITETIPNEVKEEINNFLNNSSVESEEKSKFRTLKKTPGALSLKSILSELNKLKIIQDLYFTNNILERLPHNTLKKYRDRIITEPAREVKRHPEDIRFAMFSIFIYSLQKETTDTVCDYLINILKKISKKAEKRTVKGIVKNLNIIEDKDELVCSILTALIENPKCSIEKAVYPVVGVDTIRKIIDDYKKTPPYKTKVRISMKASYGIHYRKMISVLFSFIEFNTNNTTFKPIVEAVNFIKERLGDKHQFYSLDDDVPIDGILDDDFKNFIYKKDNKGRTRVNKVAYELGVLRNLSDKLANKGLWVANADRYRDPDRDVPEDFDINRGNYYKNLNLSQDADTFINLLQDEMHENLDMLDKNIPGNADVKILKKDNGTIKLSPYEKQPEPQNIKWLKNKITKKWQILNLLDVFKESDFRINFTRHFNTKGQRQITSPKKLRKRLLLDLYAIGTNAGITRIAAGNHGEKYDDLMYTRRRYITREAIRQATFDVVNKTLEVRRPDIFGYSTTTTAIADSKQFSAYDQNLMTEWHLRYGGRGVMVYWHIEKGASCIYSQLKTCSSSEAAAMIEGVMRHSAEMKIEKQYVDTHGQSFVAFAFCYILGFNLLPRFKSVDTKKLYRPYTGKTDLYSNLQGVLTRPINWKLIKEQYDEIVKFASAIKEGTASSEAILKRFTKNGSAHPTYKALLELGKAVRTIFLCKYLYSKDLRIEINEGLNIVELWNGFNDLIFFGKSGEISSNRIESQEFSMLSLHLLQNCLVYINTLIIQEILSSPENMHRMTKEDLRALTPLIFRHINPYGNFDLNMSSRIPFISKYYEAA